MMKRIRAVWSSRKGASSVLIILIMLSLTTFGVLSIMSAWSDLKLSRKNAVWVQEYYQLDTRAETMMVDLRAQMPALWDRAGEAVRQLSSGGAPDGDVPEDLGAMARAALDAGMGEDDVAWHLYVALALPVVEEAGFEVYLMDEPTTEYFWSASREDLCAGYYAYQTLDDREGYRHLDVAFCPAVEGWDFTLLSWRQWQEPFEYEGGMNVWMGDEEEIID